jgi:hypothetical protein
MASGGLDKVQVDVAGEIVELTWAEQETLLAKLRFIPGGDPIIDRFLAVDARPRPVDLNEEQRSRLRVTLELWGVRVMPDGLSRLLVALVRADKGGQAK